MLDNNKLELVVEADVNKTALIKSINTGSSSMEQAASKTVHGAPAGIDGMTAEWSGAQLRATSLRSQTRKPSSGRREWTSEAATHAAHTAGWACIWCHSSRRTA
jgi:hypothetical protein